MKRFLLALCGGLLLIVPVFAQLGGFSQRGRATQQMETGGLRAAHNNIPLDSTVKVINTVTGKEIEVTVTGRIPISPNRIIDLSAAAWEALGLSSDTIILLVYSPSSVSPVAITPIEPAPAVPELVVPENEVEPEPAPVLAAGIKIIPALPNLNSNKIYRLQVGAYTMRATADKIERQLKAAGFEAAQEIHGSLYRVLAAEGVRAVDVITVANALGAAGFKEIWVREDTRPVKPESKTPAECAGDEERPDPASEFEPETGPEAEIETETELDPEVELEPELELEPESEPELEAETEAEPEPEPEAEIEAELETEPEPEAKIEAELEPETEADAEPEAELKPETKPAPVLAAGIRIIPGLPNPNSNKIYRLQVGAYAGRANADKMERKVKAAGFETCRETYGSLHRVLAVGIRAADVIPAANALRAAGFTEIWVRE